ncbi:MAG TPA: HNH endonuclease signature motif containing protein [Bryobacteraceae bacterium]|nr:HNH endonuclease signature motif containing protein [Bryobacteraceae bacterium]
MPSRKWTGPRQLWPEDHVSYLRAHYPHRRTAAIAAELGRNVSKVYAKASSLGLAKTPAFYESAESGRLKKGETRPGSERTQFRKGQAPPNKGLRRPGWGPGRMKETQFRKGRRPHTWKPIGTVLADHEGYLRIKVRERRPEDANGWNPEIWPLLHHRVWQEKHGPVPAGHAVAFRNGNRSDCTIENLELIPRGELARRNRMWGRYPRELSEAIQLAGALKRRIRRARSAEEHD